MQHRILVTAAGVAVVAGAMFQVVACGSFEADAPDTSDATLEASGSDAPSEAAADAADASDAADADDGGDASSCRPSAKCTAEAGTDAAATCVATDFQTAIAAGWAADLSGIAPQYSSGEMTVTSNTYGFLTNYVPDPVVSPFTFHFAFRVKVAPAPGPTPGGAVGVATIRGSNGQLLILKATSAGRFTLCERKGVTFTCMDVGAFTPNAWHHIAWTGTMNASTAPPAGAVGVSVNCGPVVSTVLQQAFFESGTGLYFDVGVTSVEANYVSATVTVDDLIRSNEP